MLPQEIINIIPKNNNMDPGDILTSMFQDEQIQNHKNNIKHNGNNVQNINNVKNNTNIIKNHVNNVHHNAQNINHRKNA